MTILDRRLGGRGCFGGLVCIGALCSALSACGGGGSNPSGGGSSSLPPGSTSLNCDGYPQSDVVSTPNSPAYNVTQVCLLLQEYAAVTPSLSASTKAGNVTAHGGQASDTFLVNARIIAQAADQNAATALAKSVVITAANGTISATPDQVDFPQNLTIDFEINTASSTNLTLTAGAGSVAVDNYNATLGLTTQAGSVSLKNVAGDVTIDVGAGNVDAMLSGSGWTGTGMTASVQTGSISMSRPATYQASFTAQSDNGTASIDGKEATSFPQGPAVVTSGSGAPIMLRSKNGAVTVVATQ
jgi:hypothetical protein